MIAEAKDIFTKKNRIAIGYDLSQEYAQISVLPVNGEEREPETVSLVAGAEQYQIPLVLCKRLEVNQWYYGREALRCAEAKEGVLVTGLFERAAEREQVSVGEESFDAVSLLALFIKRSLSLVPTASLNALAGLTITVPRLDHELLGVLSEALLLLQLKTDRLFVQSHMESFYEYTIHQPKELWKNQVAVFDFSGEHMVAYRMECNKHTTPVVAFIEQTSYPGLCRQPFLSDRDRADVYEDWDRQFQQVVEEVTDTRLISTAYLIGEGFHGDWCKDSLKTVCRGRRVFQGSNLYSKGASYAAREKIAPTQIGADYVFLGNDKLKSNIGMRVLRRGELSYLALLDAGINWFEANKSCQVILESGNSFSILVTPVTRGGAKELTVILEGLEERKRATTRLSVSVCMVSALKCRLEIEDLGFGEIVPATHQIWREEFELSI